MQQECSKSKTSALVRILRRIDEGEDLRLVAQEAGQIAGDVGPGEMAAAQDRLRENGYPEIVIAQLSAAFVLAGVYERQKSRALDPSPPADILQTVNAEHALFRALAGQLVRVLEDIRALDSMADTSVEYRRLVHVVRHLQGMNEHFDREEDAIFPYLRRQGWAALCRMAAVDHEKLRDHVGRLAVLVGMSGEFQLQEFKSHLTRGISSFCQCLHEHLSFEDGLLWPIALVVIDDPATWKTIMALCDEIGYCGVHA